MNRALSAFTTLLLAFIANIECADEYGNRPRGTDPSVASLYQEDSKGEFQCLDGSEKILFSRVNDDYCDCADGSDEPGTSACSNGHFYCRNFGYGHQTIPSSRVNDGICDCCDGSDEWDSGVECPNICHELGEKAREQLKQVKKIHERGFTIRNALSKEGVKVLEEKRIKLSEQKKELDELLPLKSELESTKNEAEKFEKEAKDVFDTAWNEQQAKKRDEEIGTVFINLDTNKDGMLQKTEFVQVDESDQEKLTTIFGEQTELDRESFGKHFDELKDILYKKATSPPKPSEPEEVLGEKAEPGDDSDSDLEPESNNTEEKPAYDEATQDLIKKADTARKEFDEISQRVSSLELEIQNTEKILESEFGEDNSWAALKDKCIEYTSHQYIYKLCLFDRTTQRDKNGHSEVTLGYWDNWAGPDYDKYSVQKYSKGQTCWNGPDRSTIISIECGEELELIDATEPTKCEYHFKMYAPNACKNPASFDKHVEL